MKFLQKNWVMAVCFFVFHPLFWLAFFTKESISKKWKISMAIVWGIFILIAVFAGNDNSSSTNNVAKTQHTVSYSKLEKQLKKAGLDDGQIGAVKGYCEKLVLDINNIKDEDIRVPNVEDEGTVACVFPAERKIGDRAHRYKTCTIRLNRDNVIVSAFIDGHQIVDNNQYILELDSFTMTSSEENEARLQLKENAKAILKNPKSANFPNINDMPCTKENYIITTSSWVEGTNSFNAVVRYNVVGTYNTKTKESTIEVVR